MALTGKIEGGQIPRGSVQLSGAKNSATRLLAATLLADTPSTLLRFPTTLVDAGHKMRFMRGLGVDVQASDEDQTVTVSPARLNTSDFGADDDFPIRTTYLLVAGQIRRNGFARIPYPGGCKIGSRGYDLHVMVWRALGCEVVETPVAIEVRGDGFKAGVIDFPISTVGGTENALLCASIAKGVTEISNAYITPEIDDLIEFLRRMGAQIEVSGGSFIRVEGVDRLSGVRMPVMTDRIEALTWIVYAILSGGDIRVDGVPFCLDGNTAYPSGEGGRRLVPQFHFGLCASRLPAQWRGAAFRTGLRRASRHYLRYAALLCAARTCRPGAFARLRLSLSRARRVCDGACPAVR